MSLLDIASLMKRHVVALVLVLSIAVIAGVGLKQTKPMYYDTTTLDFKTQVRPFVEAFSLLITSDLMARSMMSSQSEQLVRQDGGTGDYQVDLVNLYNMEYPNYSVPYVSVSVTAPNPVDTERTFAAVVQVMTNELKTWQAGKGVPPANQIGLYVMSGTQGAVSLSGYPKRTFGALAVLTMIAIFLVVSFLDKHPFRLLNFRGSGRRDAYRA